MRQRGSNRQRITHRHAGNRTRRRVRLAHGCSFTRLRRGSRRRLRTRAGASPAVYMGQRNNRPCRSLQWRKRHDASRHYLYEQRNCAIWRRQCEPVINLSTTSPNIFSAYVQNTMTDTGGNPVVAQNIIGTFKIANFGLPSFGDWIIPPAMNLAEVRL